MCLNCKNAQEKESSIWIYKIQLKNNGGELLSYENVTLEFKSCLPHLSSAFYTPFQCHLVFKGDWQVCPCVRITILLHSRTSHTCVPVHINGVPVHFCFCQFPDQVYRYTFWVYRYTFATAKFLNRCTGTHIGCTSTLCPLPLFKQGVPVHINDVPVHLILWCFSSIVGVPETSSIVCPHPQCFILASRT